MAGGDADRPFALADRIDRILQARKAAAVDAVRRAARLRGERHRRKQQRKGEQRQQRPAEDRFEHASPHSDFHGASRWRSWLMQEPSLFRSEEHTSELQSLMRISYAVFCLKKKTFKNNT